MIVVLDAQNIRDRDSLHDCLTNAFHFPDWYGRNLDALYDCLTNLTEDTELFLLHPEKLETNLGKYGKAFCKVLRDVSSINPHLLVRGTL